MRALVVLLAIVGLSFGSVLEDPPDVRGLAPAEARARLTAWNQSVTVQTVPAAIPAGVDPSTVVVVNQTLVNQAQPNVATVRPQMRLTLGTKVPDLTGQTPAEANRALTARGLSLRQEGQVGPEWTVTGQAVPPGTLVEFGLAVGATFAAPPTGPPWVLIAVAGGGGLVFLLLIGLVVRALRRPRKQPHQHKKQQHQPAEPAIEVRLNQGTVIGPDLDELGTSIAVRLEPRYDPGTFTLEEELR